MLSTMKANELADLVKQKLENLRPKLLDLSRRNPLIATKLGPRSNSHIRAVDELPDILFFKLNNGQPMRLIPLPDIDDDPRDEQTASFRETLINSRLVDEEYVSEMETVDRDADDYVDQTRRIERALKDRVRDALGLAPRVRKPEVNLIQHAKINGITPSYELPTPDAEHPDGRHTDDNIQTLLLPNDLERKLNAIISKCRTWVQETGMNVLHIAYGFLEWSDGIQTETSFAPLVLCEAQIDKRRTAQGIEFSICGTGEEALINTVLAEKLRLDFGVELPPFSGTSAEQYLADVSKLSPRNMIWRVRRQVAIGVFPSARMAMYHDLDPEQPGFPQSDIIDALLGGSNVDSASPFADEYEVDDPEVEHKVPCLVMDADSSQFSTLVDMAEGKNLAVEGPPGTGKSQTIVNAIAAALAEGKKILFVAEKLAALNVVKARLEAAGLGEFLLPLQAERSTREQVITSIGERIEMRSGSAVRDFDTKLTEYRRVRQQIGKYIDLMTRPFVDTGLTIGQILGKSISTNSCLAAFPPETLERCKVPKSFLTLSGLSLLRQLGARIEEAHQEVSGAKMHWKPTRLMHPERFTIEEACDLAARAAVAFSELAEARERVADVCLPIETATAELSSIDVDLEQAQRCLEGHPRKLLLNLLDGNNSKSAQRFIDSCELCLRQRDELSQILAREPNIECLELIKQIQEICGRFSLQTISSKKLNEQLQAKRSILQNARAISSVLKPLVEARPESSTWHLKDIAKAYSLVKSSGRDAMLSRNARTNEPDAAHVLHKLCSEGRQLQAQKAELADRVSFAVEASLDALSESVSALRVAGAFRIFSRRYHNAKRLFRSVARTENYGRQHAVRTLEALIAYRRKETEFTNHPHVSALFGFQFRGVETEFGSFERLAAFYQGVDTHFTHPQKSTLRSFLRDANVTELELLPAIREIEVVITYESLQELIEQAEGEIRTLEAAVAALNLPRASGR